MWASADPAAELAVAPEPAQWVLIRCPAALRLPGEPGRWAACHGFESIQTSLEFSRRAHRGRVSRGARLELVSKVIALVSVVETRPESVHHHRRATRHSL